MSGNSSKRIHDFSWSDDIRGAASNIRPLTLAIYPKLRVKFILFYTRHKRTLIRTDNKQQFSIDFNNNTYIMRFEKTTGYVHAQKKSGIAIFRTALQQG